MKTQKKFEFVGFETLKRKVSIVKILDRYGLIDRLRRNGDSLSGPAQLSASAWARVSMT